MQLESLRALVLGGIGFATSDKEAGSAAAEESHQFIQFQDRDAADAASFDRGIRFISYFKGAVSGLSAGSPVTLHGLRIGAVTEVALGYDPAADEVTVAVRHEIEPDRIARLNLPVNDDLDKAMVDSGGI